MRCARPTCVDVARYQAVESGRAYCAPHASEICAVTVFRDIEGEVAVHLEGATVHYEQLRLQAS